MIIKCRCCKLCKTRGDFPRDYLNQLHPQVCLLCIERQGEILGDEVQWKNDITP